MKTADKLTSQVRDAGSLTWHDAAHVANKIIELGIGAINADGSYLPIRSNLNSGMIAQVWEEACGGPGCPVSVAEVKAEHEAEALEAEIAADTRTFAEFLK